MEAVGMISGIGTSGCNEGLQALDVGARVTMRKS